MFAPFVKGVNGGIIFMVKMKKILPVRKKVVFLQPI